MLSGGTLLYSAYDTVCVFQFCVVIMSYCDITVGTLCWIVTVLMFHGPQFGHILLCIVYMLPALYRPALDTSYSIRDYLFDRWFFCPGFYWYGLGPCGVSFWHSGNLPGCVCYLPRRRRPGTGDIATPPVCLSVRPSVCLSVCLSVCPSVCLSVTFSFRTVTQKRIDVFSRNLHL